MKTQAILLALALTAGAALPALADDRPGKDWMPMDQVVKSLEQAGYTNVRGLEADDGHWEGKATRDGRIVAFHADSKSGAVTEEKAEAESKATSKSDDEDDDD